MGIVPSYDLCVCALSDVVLWSWPWWRWPMWISLPKRWCPTPRRHRRPPWQSRKRVSHHQTHTGILTDTIYKIIFILWTVNKAICDIAIFKKTPTTSRVWILQVDSSIRITDAWYIHDRINDGQYCCLLSFCMHVYIHIFYSSLGKLYFLLKMFYV